jgi:1-acyl-sn-glycerol-3-phosphate acyltransferase
MRAMLRRLDDLLYAPLAAAIMVVGFFFVCLAVIAGPTLRMRRAIGRHGVRAVLLCMGVPIRVRGLEHLPAGVNIVVANHASYLDGLILTAALPARYHFVVQDGAAAWPLVGRTITRMGVIYVNRGAARDAARTTRELMRRLHRRESLAIFAEGTFKTEPGLLPFKAGAFLLAARTGASVSPVGIRGTRRLYGGGRRLPRWSRVEIDIAAPLHADGADRDAALRLRDATRAAVLRLSGETDRGDLATDTPE